MGFIVTAPGTQGRMPSPIVWGGLPSKEEFERGFSSGGYYFDDFENTAAIAAASVVGNYAFYMDTGNTAYQLATERNGVLRLATDNTDNDAIIMTTGGNIAGIHSMGGTTGCKKFMFEARVRLAQITAQCILVGLGEEAMAADSIIPDAGTFTDKDWIGFRTLEAAPSYLDATHNLAGGGGEVVVKDDAQLMVADTWYKLGVRYVKEEGASFFVNGTQVGLRVQTSATGFPLEQILCPVIGLGTKSGAARYLDIDWMAYGWED
jgi:hypothetical protein